MAIRIENKLLYVRKIPNREYANVNERAMKLNCFACSKEIKIGELCTEHSQELKNMLDDKKGVIENPTFAYHCIICGEYEGKLIIEQPSSGLYFCGNCIEENWKRQE